jgi:hypothetical protein
MGFLGGGGEELLYRAVEWWIAHCKVESGLQMSATII